jgi:hypothetical protein
MAKVTYITGIYSGKLAGQVFSRNKAGAYVRQWVKPINPRTIAQQAARTTFGNASNQYHMLTNSQKALWNAFAPFFNPKGVSIPSGISGFNAFIALNNLAKSSHDAEVTFDVLKNDTGTPLTKTNKSFVANLDAPAHNLITSYQYDGGNAPLILHPADISFAMSESGTFTFDFTLQANPSITSGLGVTNPFTDTHGNQYGFTFYMSNGVQQDHNFKKNPEIQKLFSIPNFELSAAPTAILNYGLSGTGGISPSKYQSLPVAGQSVQITVYQTGINGMCNKICSFDTTVTT